MKRALATAAALAWAQPALPADPFFANGSGKTLIRRLAPGNDLSMVVVSRAGTSVLLDPRSTRRVPDLIAITHGHHRDQAYLALASGARVVDQQTGVVTIKDVKLTGIAGGHSTAKEIKSPPEYVLYLLEVDGLRIGFFPCTSPRSFTPEQREALGSLDVAMISAETEQDGRSAKLTYALARSVHAKVVLTLTHHVGDYEFALGQIEDEGGKLEELKDPLLLDAASLEGAPERVINLLTTTAG